MHAFFTGPLGTGKTLAASILAARLSRVLVRIDLSTVVSKYIGETEKNLQRVFENAARDDVVLLFDEADVLFGQRAEVRNAHDRFANREVNFLLQAIENWHGIVALTTNAPQHIDSAFLRRMHAVITFPLPDAAERERIWRLHLPDGHVLDDAWLGELAARSPARRSAMSCWRRRCSSPTQAIARCRARRSKRPSAASTVSAARLARWTRRRPPSGVVAGVYVRTDHARGVWMAPAGKAVEVVGAAGVALALTDAENAALNRHGISCTRQPGSRIQIVDGFTPRGRVGSGSPWSLVSVRRLALYIEASLWRGTDWVVFEHITKR